MANHKPAPKKRKIDHDNETPFSVLKSAIISSDDLAMRNIFLLEFDIKSRDPQAKQLLKVAIAKRRFESARYLLELVPDVDKKSALKQAIQTNDEEFVRLLLDSGTDLERSFSGRNPILLTVEKKNLRLTKLLLQYGSNPCYRGYKYVPSAFAVAASNNQLEILKLLLEYKPEPTLRLDGGTTPLHEPECLKNIEALTALLESGASVQFKDPYGYTPILRACELGESNAFEVLLSSGSNVRAVTNRGQTALHLAVDSSNIKLVERLLGLNLKVTDSDDLGQNVLHHAARIADKDMIELLVKYIARNLSRDSIVGVLNIRDCTDGRTIMHFAASRTYCKLSKSNCQELELGTFNLLLQYGADPNVIDYKGRTPLDSFCIQETKPNIMLVFSRFNARGAKGCSPLHLAAKYDVASIIDRIATSPFVNLDYTDINGDTALHYACMQYTRHMERPIQSVKSLLAAGANITIRNRQGRTAATILGKCIGIVYRNPSLRDRILAMDCAELLPNGYLDDIGPKWQNVAPRREIGALKLACKAELEHFKGVQLRPGLSLFCWLTRYRNKRPLYAKDKQVVDKLESIQLSNFHHYRAIIKSFVRNDKLKLQYMAAASTSLDHITSFARLKGTQSGRLSRLPPEICEKILIYCNHSELYTFNLSVGQIDKLLESRKLKRQKLLDSRQTEGML